MFQSSPEQVLLGEKERRIEKQTSFAHVGVHTWTVVSTGHPPHPQEPRSYEALCMGREQTIFFGCLHWNLLQSDCLLLLQALVHTHILGSFKNGGMGAGIFFQISETHTQRHMHTHLTSIQNSYWSYFIQLLLHLEKNSSLSPSRASHPLSGHNPCASFHVLLHTSQKVSRSLPLPVLIARQLLTDLQVGHGGRKGKEKWWQGWVQEEHKAALPVTFGNTKTFPWKNSKN